MVRAPGYLALCCGLFIAFGGIATGAFLDPALDGKGDPDWMYYLLMVPVVGMLARAPWVGVVVDGERVSVRRWWRTTNVAADSIRAVATAGYSGNLNRGSVSRRYVMVVLHLGDDREVEVPELAGVAMSARARATRLREALGL